MVAIKDMEMPNECSVCPLYEGENTHCKGGCFIPYFFGDSENKKHSDCPLVEIEERKVVKCTDCNEYNHEKHYCPKFCDVIRDTTKEMQEFYKGEHEKIEKIEQIMNKESEGYIQNNPCLREIREVLEKE